MKKKTQEEFVNDVYKKYKNEYTVLGVYKGTHKKIKVRHNKCGKEFEITPASLLSGKGCRSCGYKRNGERSRYTLQEFKKKVFEKYGDEYKVLGNYVNSQTKITVKHLVCGRVFKIIPASLLSGKGCTHCNHRKGRLLTNEEFISRLHKLHGNEYTPLTGYVDSHTKVVLRHELCGNVFEMRPNNIFNGQGCPYCANKMQTKKRTISSLEIRNRLSKYKDYVVIDDFSNYQNTHTPIQFRHKKCGNTFKMSPHAFLGGERCPYCQHLGASSGEQKVKKFLDSYNIHYQYAYIIPDLVDRDHLHFDFWLPQYRIAIEYDGQQHFNKNNPWGSKESFNRIKLHDQMKDMYCEDNHIELIRIKYDQNVDELLGITLNNLIKKANKNIKNNIVFKQVSASEIKDLMENYHYLHRQVSTSYNYGLYVNNQLMGMVAYTVPRLSLAQTISEKADRSNTLELSRLYIKDSVSQTVPNITSQFVGWSLRQLKKIQNWYIISFADSGMNHVGAIYQATNFLYCGLTDKHTQYAWNGYGKHGGHWEKGHYYRYMIQSSQKYRYIKFIGSKSFKKHARRELKFDTLPYSKHDSVHYQVGDTEERLIRDRETGKIYKETELARKLGMLK